MSEAKYRLKTEAGLSGEYTLEHLKQKSTVGDVDDSAECTADNGDTWVSLRTLIIQQHELPQIREAERNEAPALPEAARTSQSKPAAKTPKESAQSLHLGTRKLRKLASAAPLAAPASPPPQNPQATRAVIRKPEDLIGAMLANDRYKIVARLGHGSMAYVLRATDCRLNTDVVVKVPKPEKMTDKDIRERFRRESQLMVELTHPHVVKVQDVGEYRELPYVIMQLLSGGTLADQIRSGADGGQRLSPDSLKSWLREVARALDFCCRKGTVHRDIKPANILFDTDENAYVSDFGLTKIMYGEHTMMDPSDTAAGVVLGTPNYIAPEIILGHKYDGRADQYSLGITAYHVLFGRPPMQGDSATATMINQTQKHLQLLSDIRSDVPREVALAIRRSIEKDPQKRFANCEEFADAVIEGLRTSSSTWSGVSAQPVLPSGNTEQPTGGMASSQSSSRQSRPAANKTPRTIPTASSEPWPEPQKRPVDKLPPNRSQTRTSREQKKNKPKKGLILGLPLKPVIAVVSGVSLAILLLVLVITKFTGSRTVPDAASIAVNEPGSEMANVDATSDTDRNISDGSSARPKQKNKKSGSKNDADSKDAQTETTAAISGSTPSAAPLTPPSADSPEASTTTESSSTPTATGQPATLVSDSKPRTNSVDQPAIAISPANLVRDVPDLLNLDAGDILTIGPPGCPVIVSGQSVWNLADRSIKTKLDGEYPNGALTSLSADGRYFVAADKLPNQEKTNLLIWDTSTGKIAGRVAGDGGKFVDLLLVSPRMLITGGRFSDELLMYDTENGSARKPIRIPEARFKSGAVAVSHDGQHLAIAAESGMAVLKISTAKSVAVMQPPGEKPRGTGKRQATGNNRPNPSVAGVVFASLNSLSFSPDNQELAGIASHPDPRLLCWNSKGELVIDESMPVDDSGSLSPELEWFPNGNNWLISGRIFDRQSGRMVYSQPGLKDGRIHVYDQDHLFGSLTYSAEKPAIMKIPWNAIRLSLASMNDGAVAWLAPQTAVSIQIGKLANTLPAIKSTITKAMTKRMQRDEIRVEESQKCRMVIDEDVPGTLRFRLFVEGSDTSLWQQQIANIKALVPAGPSQDDKKLQQELDSLTSQILSLSTPYFVPLDRALAILPILAQ